MPLTPLDFKVFGPKQFPAIHQAAQLVQHRGRATTPLQFAAQLRQLLLSKGQAADWVDDEHTRLVVNQLVWLQVIDSTCDLIAADQQLRQIMHQQPDVLITYVVRMGQPLGWRHVQISDKWLQARPPAPAGVIHD